MHASVLRFLPLAGCNVLVACLLVGCASTADQQPPRQRTESRHLAYDNVVLRLAEPAPSAPGVELESTGDGALQGVQLMLYAPVGCMQTGLLYGLCVGMSPLLPFFSASGVQESATSRQELETLLLHLDRLDLYRQFETRVRRFAEANQVALVDEPPAGTRSLTLSIQLGPLALQHDGRDHGRISVRLPYRFELQDGAGTGLAVVGRSYSAEFDARTWDGARVDREILGWIEAAATEGLRKTLVEWQPRIVLEARDPSPVEKRSLLGFRYEEWSFLPSTRPRLVWQALDDVLDPAVLNELQALSYELRIVGLRGAEVYQVSGLKRPDHQLEVELAPCAYYYWQPRARFRYRGMTFTTSLRIRDYDADNELDHFYLLKTPAPGCEQPSWPSEAATPARAGD